MWHCFFLLQFTVWRRVRQHHNTLAGFHGSLYKHWKWQSTCNHDSIKTVISADYCMEKNIGKRWCPNGKWLWFKAWAFLHFVSIILCCVKIRVIIFTKIRVYDTFCWKALFVQNYHFQRSLTWRSTNRKVTF